MKYNIPFIRPVFPDSKLITEDIEKIIASNWYTNFGPFEQQLCKDTSNYLGENTTVCTVANATLALDVSIKALFKKDKVRKNVIIPSFTFAAGGNVLLSNGLTPVFIDINKDWQPNINQAREYIKENKESTAGILLCNTFGVGNPNILEWEELAQEHNIPLIIDSAAGFGSYYTQNEKVGNRGDCEIFSLHATKPFSVGEGGLITSRNSKLINLCKQLTNFGFDDNRKITHLGINAKLSEINAAIGVRQLVGLDERLENRREALGLYKKYLNPDEYTFQTNSNASTVPFVTVLAPTIKKAQDNLKILINEGVECKQYYDPLTRQPFYKDKGIIPDTLHVTDDIADRIMCLPLHDSMDKALITKITNIITR